MQALLPALLFRIFICISFNWDIKKLGYLQQVLNNIDTYETRVDILIVTNQATQLRTLLDTWHIRHRVRVGGPQSPSYAQDKAKYKLLWEHRAYMKAAFETGRYTTYMYMEDDTYVPWHSMLSWALDTEVLEPRGFMRGFYRTEVDPATGRLVSLDMPYRLNLTAFNHTVHLPPSPFLCHPPGHAWFAHHPHAPHRRPPKAPSHTCYAHAAYLELPYPYMGMWISTHAQLRTFIAAPAWDKATALNASTGKAIYKYAERSTIWNQLVSVPPGHISASLIPYDPHAMRLAQVAAIAHLRNGYAAAPGLASIFVEDLIVL